MKSACELREDTKAALRIAAVNIAVALQLLEENDVPQTAPPVSAVSTLILLFSPIHSHIWIQAYMMMMMKMMMWVRIKCYADLSHHM